MENEEKIMSEPKTAKNISPILTVIIPSYNKEKYIAKALDSIFAQETGYDFQIIVADDCSTDSTVAIVKKYQENHPGKILLLESNENLKLYKNVLRAYEITKTDYFCVLDPDDYWINKKHLQNALDFLESNKEFSIYSTGMILKYLDGHEEIQILSKTPKSTNFYDATKGKACIASTQTVVYRNLIFKNGIPQKMLHLEQMSQEKTFRGDSFRNFIHIYKGKAYYVPNIDAVYNITNEGIWTTLTMIERNLLNANLLKDLYFYFDKRYIELLVCSYGFFCKANQPISTLASIKDKDKWELVINDINNLSMIYNEHHKELENAYYKNVSIENKIRLCVYNNLCKKLRKKGLI